jgi:pimeloyl-ACP methyl ester carboxylesterase
MSYGFGCSGSGPGNGLRDVAETIRRQYPTDRVITRAWNDDDDISRTIQNYPGPVALIGHSFGGSKSVELAARVGRPIDWIVLLDPVPCDDWAFRHSGKYFEIPAGVRNAVCFYRPAGAWPISYPIVNPATPSANRQRNLGHADFGESAEVRDYILGFCAAEAAKSRPVAAGGAGASAGGHAL